MARLLARALTLIAVLVALAAGSSTARAAGPGCVFLSQTSYIAHEAQGELQITIARTNASVGADPLRRAAPRLPARS